LWLGPCGCTKAPRDKQQGRGGGNSNQSYWQLLGKIGNLFQKKTEGNPFAWMRAQAGDCAALRPNLALLPWVGRHRVVKGPPIKKKSVTPVVGGWVRGQKRTRVRFIFSIFFYRVFELPSPRNAQKRDKKIEKKSVLDFWSNFF
jgi:hypothetical protein